MLSSDKKVLNGPDTDSTKPIINTMEFSIVNINWSIVRRTNKIKCIYKMITVKNYKVFKFQTLRVGKFKSIIMLQCRPNISKKSKLNWVVTLLDYVSPLLEIGLPYFFLLLTLGAYNIIILATVSVAFSYLHLHIL